MRSTITCCAAAVAALLAACPASTTPERRSDATPAAAMAEVDARYRAAFGGRSDGILLGMGADGHTASWFAGAKGLDEALDPDSSLRVVAIDASGAPVAGDCPLRMTLTLAAVRRGRTIVLLLFGEEKLEVLEQAACGRDPARPVSTLLASVGEALTIVWAP